MWHRDKEREEVGNGIVGRAHIAPLLREAAVRRWDLARAAKAEKGGFWADIGGYFFIFGFGGRCAREVSAVLNSHLA